MSQDLLLIPEIFQERIFATRLFTSVFSKNYFFFVLLFFRNGLQNYNLFFILQLFLKIFFKLFFSPRKRTAKINNFIRYVTFLFQIF